MLTSLPDPPPQPRMPTWAVMLLCAMALAFLGVIGVLARSWSTSLPIDAASTSPPSSVRSSSGPAFDPTASAALVEMAHALSTSVAPTPTPLPPEPTYAVATAIPPTLCGEWVQIGETCQMPKAPVPTPTPIADCPVAPQLECIWRGTLGTPVIPTPAINHGAPWSPD